MTYTPLPTHPAQNPSMWTLNQQLFRGSGSGGRHGNMIENVDSDNEVIVVSNNYDYEIVVWPMEAQCSKCNFRAYYQGMEIEPCPRYVFMRNNHMKGHSIVFKPVGKIVSEKAFTPEERERNVQCNFCKQLFTMYEKHDCPKKPFKMPFRNRDQYGGGRQCGNCLEFVYDSSTSKEKTLIEKHICFSNPKNTSTVNGFTSTEAEVPEIVIADRTKETFLFLSKGVGFLFIVMAIFCIIKLIVEKRRLF